MPKWVFFGHVKNTNTGARAGGGCFQVWTWKPSPVRYNFNGEAFQVEKKLTEEYTDEVVYTLLFLQQ